MIALCSFKNQIISRQVRNISKIAVIGSGLMGSGIAQVSASSGFQVSLVDVNKKTLEQSMNNIKKSLKRINKTKSAEPRADLVAETLARIKTTTNLTKAIEDADLVIEAAIENIDFKKSLFAQIEHGARSDAILATNTSSLRLADISEGVLKDPTRFGGLHFFNPVPMMKLLEVVRTSETSDETYASLVKYGKAIGKTTVACKDSPGFIVNRLLIPYLFEALKMYERGDASMKDIDDAMKLGAGYPMGPFELADYVGLDTLKYVMDGWTEKYPNDPTFQSSELLDKLVAEGHLGRKTKSGFYSYEK